MLSENSKTAFKFATLSKSLDSFLPEDFLKTTIYYHCNLNFKKRKEKRHFNATQLKDIISERKDQPSPKKTGTLHLHIKYLNSILIFPIHHVPVQGSPFRNNWGGGKQQHNSNQVTDSALFPWAVEEETSLVLNRTSDVWDVRCLSHFLLHRSVSPLVIYPSFRALIQDR